MDSYLYKREDISVIENDDNTNTEKLSLEGSFNLILLLGVIGSVLLSGFWRPHIYFSIYHINKLIDIHTSSFAPLVLSIF